MNNSGLNIIRWSAYVIKNEKDVTMLNHFLSKQTKERSKAMPQDTKIMLKLAELLMQDHLITPEEKLRLTKLIRKDTAV